MWRFFQVISHAPRALDSSGGATELTGLVVLGGVLAHAPN